MQWNLLTATTKSTEDEIIAELIGEEVVEVKDSQEDSQESNDNGFRRFHAMSSSIKESQALLLLFEWLVF